MMEDQSADESACLTVDIGIHGRVLLQKEFHGCKEAGRKALPHGAPKMVASTSPKFIVKLRSSLNRFITQNKESAA